MGIDEFIEGLRVALSWKNTPFSQTIRSTYDRQLREHVDAAIAALATIAPSDAEAGQLLLQNLNAAAQLDFLSAPHIASLIISPALFSHSGLRKFFLKSLGICAGCIADDATLYDHRGVTVTPGAGDRGQDGFGSAYAVSFAGDLPIPTMDRGGNRLRPIAPDAASAILGKLNAAEQLIETIDANAAAFSIQHTEVLAFRYEEEFPGSFCSGSFKTLPGFSLITNGHLRSVTERDLADAIVHEAIHAIICRFEAFGDRLVRSDQAGRHQVNSPWTGARLGVEPFAQACFVWFGLHHFWKSASDEASRNFDERAINGFVSSDYATCCRSSAQFLSPGVAPRLEELARYL